MTCGRAEGGGSDGGLGGTRGAAALGPAAVHSDNDGRTAATQALAWPSELREGNLISNHTSQPAARRGGLPRVFVGRTVGAEGVQGQGGAG